MAPQIPLSSFAWLSMARPGSREIPAWRVIVVGALTLTVVLGQLYVVLPMFDDLARLPGASPGSTAAAVTAFALPYAGGFLLLGPLVDRFGSWPVMVVSVSAVLAGTLLTASAPSWGLFLAGRIVQGLAAAPFTPAILLLLHTRVTARHRLVTTSAIVSAGMAAAAVAQIVAQLVVPAWGVSGMFRLSAVAMACCVVLVVTLLPRSSTGSCVPGASTRTVEAYRALPRLFTRPRLVLLLLAALSYLTVFVGLYAALQLTGGMGASAELLVLRASALPAIAAIPVLAPVLARIAGRTRLLVSVTVAAGVTAVLGALALVGLLAVPVFGIGMLLTAGALAVAAPATVTEVMAAAPGAAGAANALYSAAIFGGASAGTPLAVLVVGLAGTGTIGLGAFALTCAAMLVLALLLSTLALRKREQKTA